MKKNHNYKTMISEIPVANERLYQEVARLTKQNKGTVRDMVGFVGEFIASTMKEGSMQGVMLPYFGKFRPKIKHLKVLAYNRKRRDNGTIEIFHALNANIQLKRDETI